MGAETSTSFSGGLDYTNDAVPGLKLSATYYHVGFTNQVATPPVGSVRDLSELDPDQRKIAGSRYTITLYNLSQRTEKVLAFLPRGTARILSEVWDAKAQSVAIQVRDEANKLTTMVLKRNGLAEWTEGSDVDFPKGADMGPRLIVKQGLNESPSVTLQTKPGNYQVMSVNPWLSEYKLGRVEPFRETARMVGYGMVGFTIHPIMTRAGDIHL